MKFIIHSIVFTVLILLFYNCNKSKIKSETNQLAKNGTIDLSNWEIEKNGYKKLDGEWSFYWNNFLFPNQILNEDENKPLKIVVPGSWNDILINDNKIGGLGFATYKLNIKLNPKFRGQILSLKIPFIGTAYKLWINSQPIAENGYVGRNFKDSVPKYLSISKSFIVDDENLQITIHASNFHHRKGGIRSGSLLLGKEEQIQNFVTHNNIYIFFLLGSLNIMALYHFGLYILRREDYASLIFGIFCLFIGFRLFFTVDMWLTYLFPDLSWVMMYKLDYLSLYSLPTLFLFFTYFVFSNEFKKTIIYISIPIYFILSMIVVFTDPILFSETMPIFQILVTSTTLYIFYVFFKAYKNKKEGALAAFIGFGFFVITITNDLLYNNEIIISGFGDLIPFGVFMFIFSQSFILSQIFSNTFKSIKIISKNLKLTNEAYSRFVPTEFLKFLNKKSILDIELGDAIQKEMTIFFSDIRSFTSLSETMTPQENFEFLNALLSRTGPVIKANNGFIDKFIGDSIMALFPENPEDAVKAAIQIKKNLKEFNIHRNKKGYETLKIGIGINTGPVMLGTIGEPGRMDGTVISDTVNLASRVESLTKHYDTTLLITEQTLFRLKDPTLYKFRMIERVKVKGKTEPVSIFEIFDGDLDDLFNLKLMTQSDFEHGLQQYVDADFTRAKLSFKKVLKENPYDGAAKIYLKNCEYYFKHEVPSDWEGISTMLYK